MPVPVVLIVDDEDPIRSSLADFLDDEGFQTHQAESAEKALEILEGRAMDAAVVDIRLPGADGNAFILGAHEKRPGMRFIIYTGSTDYVLPASLKKTGITSSQVFHKPLQDIHTLAEALRQVLEEGNEPHE